VLEVEDLTVLTGWAQALAEALASAPECVDVLLANAKAGAPWRDELQIAQPSPQLSEAIYLMGLAARDARDGLMIEDNLTLLQTCCGEGQREEPGLEMLVRRVLKSMLEQLYTRTDSQPN
jgi:hypothetical protein